MSEVAGRLAGRTAFITGGGSGIGRALALSLAARGANVVVAVRRGHTGEETAELVKAEGGVCKSIEADCASYEQLAAAVAETERAFGGLDIMVHNAVLGHGTDRVPVETFPDDIWDRMVAVCLTGAYNCAHAGFRLLKESEHARFIAMTSTFGVHGVSIDPGYSAIKSGTRGFVKALAREWGPHGITVNAIMPSALSQAAEDFFHNNPDIKRQYFKKFPLGHLGHVRDEIAEPIATLCEPQFKFYTAGTLVLDGGMFTAL